MKNLILTGFMASGKSSVGKMLAEQIGCPFLDTDLQIEEAAHLSVNEIFRRFGEVYFRDLETEIIRKNTEKSGCIIATGGGSVLRTENRTLLRQNGILVNLAPEENVLRARLEEAAKTRPLLDDFESAKKRMLERAPYYADCDFRIPITLVDSVSDIAQKIRALPGIALFENAVR